MARLGLMGLMVMILTACGPAGGDAPLPTMMQLPSESPPTIEITITPAADMAELPYNEVVSDELGEGGNLLWHFEAQRGDTVRVRAMSSTMRLHLSLFSVDGLLMVEGDGGLEALITDDGVYRLSVKSVSGAGAFQLGLSSDRFPPPPPPTLTPIPVVVGVPTPTPALVGEGVFVGILSPSETLAGEFKVADAPHLYTFTPQIGQVVRLTLTQVNGAANPLMSLISPSGALIASDMFSDNGDGARLQNIPLAENGAYTVKIDSGGNPGLYTLRLDLSDALIPLTPTVIITPSAIPPTPVTTPDFPVAERGVRLSVNAPVSDQIRQPTDLNTHSFYAYQGDNLSVGVAPLKDSSLVPKIELIDPDGNLVSTTRGGGTPIDRDAVISGHIAPIEGPYTVYVTGDGGTVGAYLISFGYESARFDIMRGELLPDEPGVAAFERRATADVWHFYLNAGDVISASVLPLDNLVAPVLELVRADGELLGIDREGGGARSPQINGVRASLSGFHYLRVRPSDPAQLGAYQVTWRYLDYAPTPTPPPGTLPLAAINAEVEPGGYTFIPFYGQAGQTVRIYANAVIGSPLDPVAALIAPDGTTIAGSDDAPDSLDAYFEAILPADGTYQVRVNGYLSGGAFSLYIEQVFR